MTTETLSQKIDRLEKTISRCTYQINDKRNSEETIDIFTKAKAEAVRQLAECTKDKNENADKSTVQENIKPHFEEKKPHFDTKKNTASKSDLDKSGNKMVIEPHLQEKKPHLPPISDKSNQSENEVVFYTTGSGPTLKVKIEWVGQQEGLVLGQGDTLSKLTTLLRDCADSTSARIGNWEKFKAGKSFRKLVLFYKAYSIFPRASGATMPTQEDIGKHHLMGNVRGKIWDLIQEEVNAA